MTRWAMDIEVPITGLKPCSLLQHLTWSYYLLPRTLWDAMEVVRVLLETGDRSRCASDVLVLMYYYYLCPHSSHG